MKCEKRTLLLYAVTDRSWVGDKTLRWQVEEALKGGVTCVQLREKDMPEEDFLKEAEEIKVLCRSYGVPFLINDNVTLAVRCKADGIHVGQRDMQAGEVRRRIGDAMLLGVSAQTVEQAVEAEKTEPTIWESARCLPPPPKRMRRRLHWIHSGKSAVRFPFRSALSAGSIRGTCMN